MEEATNKDELYAEFARKPLSTDQMVILKLITVSPHGLTFREVQELIGPSPHVDLADLCHRKMLHHEDVSDIHTPTVYGAVASFHPSVLRAFEAWLASRSTTRGPKWLSDFAQ